MIEKPGILTATLENYLNQLSSSSSGKRYEILSDALHEQKEEWVRALSELGESEDRAAIVHSLIDRAIQKTESDPVHRSISCKKGCSFCCHTPVNLTETEALRIENFAQNHNVTWNPLKASLQNEVKDLKLYTKNLHWDDSACIFLDANGACRIYEVRPASCRRVSVVSDPKMCDAREEQTPSYYVFMEAEVIASAFYSLELKGLTTISRYFSARQPF